MGRVWNYSMSWQSFAFIALILAGCTAPGSLKEVEPLSTKLTPYRHLTINVTASDRELRDSTGSFSQRLASRIKKERAFSHVTQRQRKGSEGDLQLHVELLRARAADKEASPYRAVAELIRSRDDRRLTRLEVPGDDYGVVTSSDPLIRAQESMSNRLARYLKAQR
jgi:hypothetical protein